MNSPNPTQPRTTHVVNNATLFVNRKGQITLDPRIVYREGAPVIEVRTRYTHGVASQGPFYYITTTYPCTQVPATLKDKKELLRNMATLHAMTLGHDYKLRSKL